MIVHSVIYHRFSLLKRIVAGLLCTTAVLQAAHQFSVEYCYTHIKTTDGDQYNIYSPALNYFGDFRILNFRLHVGVSALKPLWASQNGKNYYNYDYYNRVAGCDLFIGLSRNVPIIDHFTVIPAFGWHVNGIRLRAKSRYLDFYSLTSGVGIHVLARRRTQKLIFNTAYVSLNLDFRDLLYTNNRLRHGHTIKIGLGHAF